MKSCDKAEQLEQRLNHIEDIFFELRQENKELYNRIEILEKQEVK